MAHKFVGLSVGRSMRKKNNEDRISQLPDSLLHHILSFLDTLQVVQTCVLSKRWKSVWTFIPTLYFNLNSYPFKESAEYYENDELKIKSFRNFVLRVLSKLCGSNIIKLRYFSSLIMSYKYDSEKILVEFLISYAACHMVQELDINSTTASNSCSYDWTPCLSACQSLNVMKIKCRCCDVWGVLTLPLLRVLEIDSTRMEPILNFKEKMFSGFPNLESLVLIGFSCEGFVTICAPKLDYFEYRFYKEWNDYPQEIELCTPNLRCVKFYYEIPNVKSASDFPFLDQVNIVGPLNYPFLDQITREPFDSPCSRDTMIEYAQEVAQFLSLFHNVRSITMPLSLIQALLSVPISISANVSFHNLRHLKLEVCKLSKKINLPVKELHHLLKCPTLETMLIDLKEDFKFRNYGKWR